VVFIDDILVYSKSWEEHLHHLKAVFLLLQQHQLKVKLSKCAFAKQQVHYLGHVISKNGVATDPTKVQDILNWPTPQSVRDVRGFLGLAGYYRKFVWMTNDYLHDPRLISLDHKLSNQMLRDLLTNSSRLIQTDQRSMTPVICEGSRQGLILFG